MLAARLLVDLAAITRNYRLLASRFSGQETAAVVKANAYGLGAPAVTRALLAEGCRSFFVATLEEALSLRDTVEGNYSLHVFSGVMPGEEVLFINNDIHPVLNTPSQLELWAKKGAGHAAALHIDTGMCRLGLTAAEAETILASPKRLEAAHIRLIMSHLACAGEADHPLNAQQRNRLVKFTSHFPHIPISFCNSSGIFMESSFHFQVARPGCSLYGINPFTSAPNPMDNTVRLLAPILQVRVIDRPESIGYGATHQVGAGSILATVGMGYADGYHRTLSNRARGYIGEYALPLLGRVSMDMITLDVSHVPQQVLDNTQYVELIGANIQVDELATMAGTIGYEIFTGIGARVKREYIV